MADLRPRCVRSTTVIRARRWAKQTRWRCCRRTSNRTRAALDKLEKAASCLSREHTVALRPIPGPALAPTHRSSRRLFLTHAGQGVAARLVEAKQRVEPGEVGDPLGDARRWLGSTSSRCAMRPVCLRCAESRQQSRSSRRTCIHSGRRRRGSARKRNRARRKAGALCSCRARHEGKRSRPRRRAVRVRHSVARAPGRHSLMTPWRGRRKVEFRGPRGSRGAGPPILRRSVPPQVSCARATQACPALARPQVLKPELGEEFEAGGSTRAHKAWSDVSLRLELPAMPDSVPEARTTISALCEQLGIEIAVAERVRVAVTEACTGLRASRLSRLLREFDLLLEAMPTTTPCSW